MTLISVTWTTRFLLLMAAHIGSKGTLVVDCYYDNQWSILFGNIIILICLIGKRWKPVFLLCYNFCSNVLKFSHAPLEHCHVVFMSLTFWNIFAAMLPSGFSTKALSYILHRIFGICFPNIWLNHFPVCQMFVKCFLKHLSNV